MKFVESSTPTEVFVKVNEQVAMGNDKLHLNLDVVAVKDGQAVPNQKIILELNGNRKTVVTPDDGILKEHDIMFDCVAAIRNRLVAWAEESGIKTELDIVPEDYEQKIKQNALTEAEKKYSDQIRNAQEEVTAHRREIERLQVLAGLRAPIEESPKEHGEFTMRMEADYHKMVTALEKFGIQKIGIPEWLAITSSLTKKTISKVLKEISDPTLVLVPPISRSVNIEAIRKAGMTVGVYADIANDNLWNRESTGVRSNWRICIVEGANEPLRKFDPDKCYTDPLICSSDIYFALAMRFLAEGQRFDYGCKTVLHYSEEEKRGLVGGQIYEPVHYNYYLSLNEYYQWKIGEAGIRYFVEIILAEQNNSQYSPSRYREKTSLDEILRRLSIGSK